MIKIEIEIPIAKVKDSPDITIPRYAHPGDAGFDFVSPVDVSIPPGERITIDTNTAFSIPTGFELQVRSRSGLAAKYGIIVLNAPGTIDSGYRGSVRIILFNTGKTIYEIKEKDRIAQGVICPIYRVKFIYKNEL